MSPRPSRLTLAAIALLMGLLAARQGFCRPCAAEARLLAQQLEMAGVP